MSIRTLTIVIALVALAAVGWYLGNTNSIHNLGWMTDSIESGWQAIAEIDKRAANL